MGSAGRDTVPVAAAWEAVNGLAEAAAWAATVPVLTSALGPSQVGHAGCCTNQRVGGTEGRRSGNSSDPPSLYVHVPSDLGPYPSPGFR